MAGSAKATLLVENDRVIITRYDFGPGDNTGWHRHANDYVVIPLGDGRIRLEAAEGAMFADLKSGVPYCRNAGVEHDVINATGSDYSFIEIELKP